MQNPGSSTSRRTLLSGATALLLTPALLASPSLMTSASAAANEPQLLPGQALVRGQSVVSPSGRFRLLFQEDQNVVLLGPDRGIGPVRYHLNTRNSGAVRLVLQTDGNLVLYTASNAAVWQSATNGTGSGNRLVMQDDGNLVIYNATNVVHWQSYTREDWTTLRPGMQLTPGESLTNGPYRLAFQADDRNLVVYNAQNAWNWNANIGGRGCNLFRMQTDGNLVAYSGNTSLWQSGTAGNGNALVMQADGNLVIYNGAKALWDSLGNTRNTPPAQGFIRPARGPISSEYGSRSGGFHYGIDIDGDNEDPISASRAGKVSRVAYDSGWGNYVTIDHGTVNGKSVSTRYAHLIRRSPLSEGASIAQGAFVGSEGSTGNSTGPHLHFEVIENGARINPRTYVSF